jgi:hypothetical protein
VATPAPIHVRLEIERDGERIAGRLSTAEGLTVPFIGWLGLAAALEQATAPADPSTTAGGRDDRRS